jgi:epoxyqueuosine reductase
MQERGGVDGAALLAQLRERAASLGFSQIGVADVDLSAAEAGLTAWLQRGFHGSMQYMQRHGMKRARPAELVPGTVRVITARMDYLPRAALDGEPEVRWQAKEWQRIETPQQATVSIYARGRDYHKVLRARLQQLADHLAEAVGPYGHRVFTDSAPVLEVELAARSGLGWRGKHTLALSRDAGSMFFLGEIFVDVPLPVTPPASAHCGACTACIDVCPTRAIVGPYRLDARRCISYLTIEHDGAIPVELRAVIGNRIVGCDDCQLVCPWNKYARRSTLPDFDVREAFEGATLVALWAWSEEEFLRRTEGSAIRRIGHARWQRNLAVALGNALRGGADERIERALRERRASASPLLCEHIDWALAQAPGHGSTEANASHAGTLSMPSNVDNVTSPATNGPSPPMRAAST